MQRFVDLDGVLADSNKGICQDTDIFDYEQPHYQMDMDDSKTCETHGFVGRPVELCRLCMGDLFDLLVKLDGFPLPRHLAKLVQGNLETLRRLNKVAP